MTMEDIAPKLLEDILADFDNIFENNEKIRGIYKKVRDGTATYADANEFAIVTGEILSSVLKEHISSDVLPEGRMYYNIAQRILQPTMENNHNLVADMSADVQTLINIKNGIGIKAVKAELNQSRIDGIVSIVSGKEIYDEIAYMLDEPIINFTESVVDETVRANADFHFDAGLSPKIRRTVAGGCCDWCAEVAGAYDYEEVKGTGNNVFRRHKYCRCTVEYDPGNGKSQNAHTKKWSKETDNDKIKIRKQGSAKLEAPRDKERRIAKENGTEFAARIADHPKMLQAYTPNGLKEALENAGYQIKPMNRGNFKGISFEEGGGYKINFGGDGILMYHPEERSHHKSEYYKISTGKGGTRRYDKEGNEIKDD